MNHQEIYLKIATLMRRCRDNKNFIFVIPAASHERRCRDNKILLSQFYVKKFIAMPLAAEKCCASLTLRAMLAMLERYSIDII